VFTFCCGKIEVASSSCVRKFYRAFNNILNVRQMLGSSRDEMLAVRLVKTYCLPSLLVRGDMIEVYKIVSEKYDSTITPTLIISDKHKTRGHDLRLQKFRLNMICVSFTLLTGLFTNEIA